MSPVLKTLLIAVLPLLLIVLVNTTGPAPAFEYRPDRCTRYCEQHGCLHERLKYESREALINKWWYKLYRMNVMALDAIPLLDYRQANIILYLFFYPGLYLFLIYRLIKTHGKIS